MHDLGGKQGFGRVKYPSPPHAETWEPLVRALSAFAIKRHIYNMDEFRHAIERMAPRHYIGAPYYERHLTAVATLLRGKVGVVVGISPPYPFPDASGHSMQAPMEPTYDVRFRARDLWPESCDDALNHVAVFQSDLEKTDDV